MRRWIEKILSPAPGATPSRVYAWTFFSGSLYAASSFFVLMVTTNLLGGYYGGIVAIALTLAQQVYPLGAFCMRSYQVSDVIGRYSFSDYAGSRVLTCALMIVVGLGWCLFGSFSSEKQIAIVWLVLLKGSEAFSDVLAGQYQLKGRLDVSGRILAAKTAVATLVFAISLWSTRSVSVSLACMAITHIALIAAMDFTVLPGFGGLRLHFNLRKTGALLFACLPLAIDSFLRMYINNGPKFAIDRQLDEESMAAYSSIFMVSFVVSLFADFIISPQVVPLSTAYYDKKHSVFHRALLRQILIVLSLGALGIVSAWMIGAQMVTYVFGINLIPYRTELCLLILGGVFLALYQIGQLVLIVLRKQAWCLLGIFSSAIFVCCFSRQFVARWMLKGGAICYLCSMIILSFVISIPVWYFLTHSDKQAAR